MKKRKAALIILMIFLVLPLAGCRIRTGINTQGSISSDTESTETNDVLQGKNTAEQKSSVQEAETADSEADVEPGGRTTENPEAQRKEYDEDAPAEIIPGTDRLLHAEGEGSGMPMQANEEEKTVSQADEQAEETATQTIAAQEAEQKGVSEDADAANSVYEYYAVLLQERAGSLYECKRAEVYWETADDHVTIHKSQPEHTLIVNAGAYDVSARLLPENLQVDDGWVVRKNPGVIVKIVGSEILGSSIYSARAAKSARQELISRDGWNTIDAVRSGRVLLLSQELMESPYLQLAAMLMIAQTANPSLFEDTDPDDVLQALTEEATGTLPSGIYYYSGKEE